MTKRIFLIIVLCGLLLETSFSFATTCGKYSSNGAFNDLYIEGFYPGWFNNEQHTTENFCIAGVSYPTDGQAKINGRKQAYEDAGKWNRDCVSTWDNNSIEKCTALVLPLEKSVCLQTETAWDTKPAQSEINQICKKADAHGVVDPGFPVVTALSGGGGSTEPWTWTCGGKYYIATGCEAPSKGKCMDTVNKTYDDFQKSGDVCQNGLATPVVFNSGTYQREWTCQGSAKEYNVDCFAQKKTEQGECNFAYNNGRFDELNTTGFDLCTKGVVTGFVENNSNDNQIYGWNWTCKGSIDGQEAQCSAHKNVVAGTCNTVYTMGDNKELTIDMDLCSLGTATGLTLDTEAMKRTWQCLGSREKDNVACEGNLATTAGACGSKSGQPSETLTIEDNLCSVGTPDKFKFDEVAQQWTWTCTGYPDTLGVECTAYKAEAGICNSNLSGEAYTYEQLSQLSLCEKGIASPSTLPAITSGGVRTWTCGGVGGLAGQSCSAKQILTGVSVSVPNDVVVLPSVLCKQGIPKNQYSIEGKRVWECEGFNGGATDQGVAHCVDGKCAGDGATSKTCDSPNGCLCDGEMIAQGEICELKGDGKPTAIYDGGACRDVDGCFCAGELVGYGVTCKKKGDGVPTSLEDGQTCADNDGCLCHGLLILNGADCHDPNDPQSVDYRMPIFRPGLGDRGSLYDASMILSGDADLSIAHTTTKQKVQRRDQVRYELTYKNDGPDPAYGAYIAYKYDDVLKDIETSLPHTIVTVKKLHSNDQNIQHKSAASTSTSTSTSTGDIVTTGSTTGTIITPPSDVTNDPTIDANNQSQTEEQTTTKAYSDIYQNVIYIFIGTLEPGQTGSLIITGTVKATMLDNQATNIAQIQSRVSDPDKLNNTKSATADIEDQYMSLNVHLINPLLWIQPILDKKKAIIDWIDAPTQFRDVLIGNPRYMHIMTVQRNGIMKGYEYKYSTMFRPKQCISRLEYLIVMGRIMHLTADYTDVYDSTLVTNPYKDVPNVESLSKYVNRAHAKGLIDVFKAGKSLPDVLGKDKPVKHREAKEILYRLYKIMNANTNVLKPLLVGTGTGRDGSCLRREEAAYTIAHILRGNQAIVMGFNDVFLSKLYDLLLPQSIVKRRDMLSRLLLKLKLMSPEMLFKLGLDKETLVGILASAMKGEEYKPLVNTNSTQNFFYEVSNDEYDKYIKSLY